jgi:CubicO group peptidase (beta-lactamase class C family)
MAEGMQELHLPGLVYGVILDGELALVRGLGHRDLEAKAPVDADTVFRIASMTKSFTALAILKLRYEGKLALDDPVARHVPELGALPPPTEDSGPITIRQLLSHTAGLPEDNPWGDRQLATSEEELSAWLRQGLPFSTAPGTAFEYSNYGFAILGRVISRASGMRYQDYIDREILKPLGMTSTFWNPREAPRERLANGYRRQGEEFVIEEPLGDGSFGAIGGLLTSARDLGRWVALMLSAWPPRDDPERPPVLRRTLREMQQGNAFTLLFANRPVPGAPLNVRFANYGFGLFSLGDCRVHRAVSHSGGLPGSGSDMRWLPEHGVGVFAMSNVTYAPVGRLTREMLDVLTGTGALEPRRPVPAPALLRAVDETALLLDVWDDARAQALAAGNLFLDQPLLERKEEITKLRDGLGVCHLGEIEAENALRGRFRMSCDNGWLDATLTLAPTQPPRVQALTVTGGRPLAEGMSRAVDAVLAAVIRGSQDLRPAPGLDRAALGALLANVRLEYGTCRAGEPLEGDGTTRTVVKLDCDRGPLKLSLLLDGDRVSEVRFDPPEGVLCPP